MKVAIIPARGGSKRIPRKNIRDFRGRPMLAWSIRAALDSELFDEVMVTTDDPEIADAAQREGASVPFLRSKQTSNDYATTADVLREVLDVYEIAGRSFDVGCCLYATAPLTNAADLQEGHRQLLAGSYAAVMPVALFSYPIWRSLGRSADGRVSLNFPEHLNARSQDLPAAYHDAGQWYWFDVPTFRREGALIGPNTGSIVLSEMRVQDIDNEDDWSLAELKHEKLFG